MATIREIATKFTLQGIDGARKLIGKMSDSVRDFSKSAVKHVGTVSTAFAKLSASTALKGGEFALKGVAAAAVLAKVKVASIGIAALESSKQIAEMLKRLGTISRVTGASAQDIATAQFALKQEGGDPDELLQSLGQIANEFGQVKKQIDAADKSFDSVREWGSFKAHKALKAGDFDAARTEIDAITAARLNSPKAIQDRMSQILDELNRTGGDNSKNADRYRLALVEEYKNLESANQKLEQSMGPVAKAMYELRDSGLDVDKAMKGDINTLFDIADAMQKVQDRSDRLRLSMMLFGEDSGAKMLPILENGRSGILKYRQRQQQLGTLPTDSDVALGTASAKAEEERNQAIQGVRLQAARGILPLYTQLNQQITEFLIRNRELIAQYMTGAFDAVRRVISDSMKLFEGRSDFESALFRTGAKIVAWTKRMYVAVRGLAAVTIGEVSKVLSGQNSDWGWLNKARDAFLVVKGFAMDAFSVLTGGSAKDYQWMNDLADYARKFFQSLKDAWAMFRTVLGDIHALIKPVLELFGTNILTMALFVGMLRMSGLLKLMTGTIGVLSKGFGVLFSGIGSQAELAAGGIGKIGGKMNGLLLGLTKFGTYAAAAIGAWELGKWIGTKMSDSLREGYEKVSDQYAELIRINGEEAWQKYMQRPGQAGVDARIRYYRNTPYDNGRETAYERQARIDKFRADAASGEGAEVRGVYIPPEEAQRLTDDQIASIRDPWVGRREADMNVNFVVAGKNFMARMKEDAARGLAAEADEINRSGGDY